VGDYSFAEFSETDGSDGSVSPEEMGSTSDTISIDLNWGGSESLPVLILGIKSGLFDLSQPTGRLELYQATRPMDTAATNPTTYTATK
jgi:hypothetical protein